MGKDNEDPSGYVESASSSSIISLSQDFSAPIVSDEVDHEEEVSHIVPIATNLFDSNASSFNQEENIEEPSFSVSLEVEDLDSSSYDAVDEKEVTNGDTIAIDDSITQSVFSIMDSEIHMTDLSHFVHSSLLDCAQPSDFQDVCLAKSSPSSVFPLTILDPMCFCNSSFVLSTHSQILLEYFGHHYLSSSHTFTIEDSLPLYSHESIVVLICDLLAMMILRNHTYLKVYKYWRILPILETTTIK